MTMQPIAPGTEIRCPLCGVLMTYRARDHYWECPVTTCRLQVWPPLPEPDYRSAEEMFHDLSRPPGGMIKKGGKEGVGRKRKKPRKRHKNDELEK